MTTLATQEQRKEFFEDLGGIRAGMLGVDENMKPMSHYVDQDDNALWFIGAKGTDLAQETRLGERDAHYVIASDKDNMYATLRGTLTAKFDPKKKDEIWNIIADSWFEDGKADPDVHMMKFSIKDAEVWTTDGTPKFLYEIAKAQMTGSKPDIGDNFRIVF
jgi:general stress protein 26